MQRRARIVRPVVHGGDAGVGELDQAEHHAGVEILRGEKLGGGVLRWEIAEAVADEVAPERAPHVIVRVDEARHDDHVGGVNGLGARNVQIGSDRLDPSVVNMHICARQHACSVHGDNRAVLDYVVAARKQRRRGLRKQRPDQRRSGEPAYGCCTQQTSETSAVQHCVPSLVMLARYGAAHCRSTRMTRNCE